MLRYIQEVLQTVWKEKAKVKIRRSKENGFNIRRVTPKIKPETLAADTANEKHDIDKSRDLEKLKKTYNMLMKKFVNPRLELIAPGLLPLEQLNHLNLKKKQENNNPSFINKLIYKGARRKLPALPSNISKDDLNSSVPESELSYGWSGQLTNKHALSPKIESSSDPYDIASAFFMFPEREELSKGKTKHSSKIPKKKFKKTRPRKLNQHLNLLQKSNMNYKIKEQLIKEIPKSHLSKFYENNAQKSKEKCQKNILNESQTVNKPLQFSSEVNNYYERKENPNTNDMVISNGLTDKHEKVSENFNSNKVNTKLVNLDDISLAENTFVKSSKSGEKLFNDIQKHLRSDHIQDRIKTNENETKSVSIQNEEDEKECIKMSETNNDTLIKNSEREDNRSNEINYQHEKCKSSNKEECFTHMDIDIDKTNNIENISSMQTKSDRQQSTFVNNNQIENGFGSKKDTYIELNQEKQHSSDNSPMKHILDNQEKETNNVFIKVNNNQVKGSLLPNSSLKENSQVNKLASPLLKSDLGINITTHFKKVLKGDINNPVKHFGFPTSYLKNDNQESKVPTPLEKSVLRINNTVQVKEELKTKVSNNIILPKGKQTEKGLANNHKNINLQGLLKDINKQTLRKINLKRKLIKMSKTKYKNNHLLKQNNKSKTDCQEPLGPPTRSKCKINSTLKPITQSDSRKLLSEATTTTVKKIPQASEKINKSAWHLSSTKRAAKAKKSQKSLIQSVKSHLKLSNNKIATKNSLAVARAFEKSVLSNENNHYHKSKRVPSLLLVTSKKITEHESKEDYSKTVPKLKENTRSKSALKRENNATYDYIKYVENKSWYPDYNFNERGSTTNYKIVGGTNQEKKAESDKQMQNVLKSNSSTEKMTDNNNIYKLKKLRTKISKNIPRLGDSTCRTKHSIIRLKKRKKDKHGPVVLIKENQQTVSIDKSYSVLTDATSKKDLLNKGRNEINIHPETTENTPKQTRQHSLTNVSRPKETSLRTSSGSSKSNANVSVQNKNTNVKTNNKLSSSHNVKSHDNVTIISNKSNKSSKKKIKPMEYKNKSVEQTSKNTIIKDNNLMHDIKNKGNLAQKLERSVNKEQPNTIENELSTLSASANNVSDLAKFIRVEKDNTEIKLQTPKLIGLDRIKGRRLHSKKSYAKKVNLKMYGSAKRIVNDPTNDLHSLKNVPVVHDIDKNKKLLTCNSSNLLLRECLKNKSLTQEPCNIFTPTKIKSRNLFTAEYKANMLINYVYKRYITTVTTQNKNDKASITKNANNLYHNSTVQKSSNLRIKHPESLVNVEGAVNINRTKSNLKGREPGGCKSKYLEKESLNKNQNLLTRNIPIQDLSFKQREINLDSETNVNKKRYHKKTVVLEKKYPEKGNSVNPSKDCSIEVLFSREEKNNELFKKRHNLDNEDEFEYKTYTDEYCSRPSTCKIAPLNSYKQMIEKQPQQLETTFNRINLSKAVNKGATSKVLGSNNNVTDRNFKDSASINRISSVNISNATNDNTSKNQSEKKLSRMFCKKSENVNKSTSVIKGKSPMKSHISENENTIFHINKSPVLTKSLEKVDVNMHNLINLKASMPDLNNKQILEEKHPKWKSKSDRLNGWMFSKKINNNIGDVNNKKKTLIKLTKATSEAGVNRVKPLVPLKNVAEPNKKKEISITEQYDNSKKEVVNSSMNGGTQNVFETGRKTCDLSLKNKCQTENSSPVIKLNRRTNAKSLLKHFQSKHQASSVCSMTNSKTPDDKCDKKHEESNTTLKELKPHPVKIPLSITGTTKNKRFLAKRESMKVNIPKLRRSKKNAQQYIIKKLSERYDKKGDILKGAEKITVSRSSAHIDILSNESKGIGGMPVLNMKENKENPCVGSNKNVQLLNSDSDCAKQSNPNQLDKLPTSKLTGSKINVTSKLTGARPLTAKVVKPQNSKLTNTKFSDNHLSNNNNSECKHLNPNTHQSELPDYSPSMTKTFFQKSLNHEQSDIKRSLIKSSPLEKTSGKSSTFSELTNAKALNMKTSNTNTLNNKVSISKPADTKKLLTKLSNDKALGSKPSTAKTSNIKLSSIKSSSVAKESDTKPITGHQPRVNFSHNSPACNNVLSEDPKISIKSKAISGAMKSVKKVNENTSKDVGKDFKIKKNTLHEGLIRTMHLNTTVENHEENHPVKIDSSELGDETRQENYYKTNTSKNPNKNRHIETEKPPESMKSSEQSMKIQQQTEILEDKMHPIEKEHYEVPLIENFAVKYLPQKNYDKSLDRNNFTTNNVDNEISFMEKDTNSDTSINVRKPLNTNNTPKSNKIKSWKHNRTATVIKPQKPCSVPK